MAKLSYISSPYSAEYNQYFVEDEAKFDRELREFLDELCEDVNETRREYEKLFSRFADADEGHFN